MIVVDTETTGMEEKDQVIEMALVWVPAGGHYHFMVRPSVPVNVEARATHHITDRQLECCADAEQWRRVVETQLQGNGTPVFHNSEFDLRLIRQTWPGIELPPAICTWRCALHLWPEAPSHSNQVLRYWRGLEPKIRTPLPPHRSLPDAAVTAALVEDMLRTHTEEQLLELTRTPVILYKCGFGKHRGELWAEVPRDYLQWILRQPDFDPDTVHTARHYLQMPAATSHVVYKGNTIETGQEYVFTYRPGRDEGAGGDGCADHSGQVVRVTRLLHHGAVAVQAADGWTGNAFHHELLPVKVV